MPLDLLTEALDQVASSWPDTTVGWAFTEPSIYPHLLPSLEHAKRRGLRTTMTTNGARLPKLAADLVRVGLDELFVSLDGPATCTTPSAVSRAPGGVPSKASPSSAPTVRAHRCSRASRRGTSGTSSGSSSIFRTCRSGASG
jgi:hypothetical protein